MVIEEHKHCKKCGKIVYARRGRMTGGETYFPELCEECNAS